MGIFDRFKRLLKRKKAIQSIQSIERSIQSDSIDSIDKPKPKEKALLLTGRGFTESRESLTPDERQPSLEKDSFRLGLAAGYTGKSIKEIEHSLARMEGQMVTKDWFKTEFEDQTPKLVENLENIREILEKHDSSVQNRFKAIQSSLDKMKGLASRVPEPVKTDILKEIKTIKNQIPLSSKMKELVSVVKSVGELSYKDLATRLGITTSALRGLLSNTMKRTDEIERFRRGGKGWVRYKG
jgi:inorganic triphosphatase YgiF